MPIRLDEFMLLFLGFGITKWFKSHPDYQPGAQPENNNGVVMSEPNPIHI